MPTDGTTLINPAGFLFTFLMGVMLIIVPRRFAFVPVLILTCFMTMGQRIIIETLDFTMLRILVVFGWLRLIVRQEIRFIRFNAIDRAILWWTFSSIITYTLLWQNWGALINRLGLAYNAVGMYFLFRLLIRNMDDVIRVFKVLAILVFPLAFLMVIEKTTGSNIFSIFGGVPESTVVRDGVLRCQGPFAHPILAGSFGAAMLPFFVSLWWLRGASRLLAIVGVISSVIITITAGSSGPVFASLAAVVGLVMWLFRKHMRTIRWGLILMLVALALVMKAPVWYLIARVNVFSGSTGYHRAYLIDQAIAHLPEWWLVGTKSTAHWGLYLADVTNQYIRVGVGGGLITLILFITIITMCFRSVGRTIRAMGMENNSRQFQFCVWAMGAALLAHLVTFISVTYFDQNFVVWYLLLAMISSVGALFPSASTSSRSAISHSRTDTKVVCALTVSETPLG